jgi:hypothetical protein
MNPKTCFFVYAEQIMDIEPSFLAVLEELLNSRPGDRPETATAEIVSFATQALLKRVYAVNPYLNISDQKVKELQEIYLQTWRRMIRTGDLQTALREGHYPALLQWLASLYPKEFRKRLKFSPVVVHVVYEEYSAQLQIELLQIDMAHMKEPVMDVGCGGQANLARYLRSLGIEAYGFDRHLEIVERYLEERDWFDYLFEAARWGTIISNMAFTNHLNYAYLHDASQLEKYLLKMRELIESLAVGGNFYYAPSLPFVENRFTPERYRTEREQTLSEIFVSTVAKIA